MEDRPSSVIFSRLLAHINKTCLRKVIYYLKSSFMACKELSVLRFSPRILTSSSCKSNLKFFWKEILRFKCYLPEEMLIWRILFIDLIALARSFTSTSLFLFGSNLSHILLLFLLRKLVKAQNNPIGPLYKKRASADIIDLHIIAWKFRGGRVLDLLRIWMDCLLCLLFGLDFWQHGKEGLLRL